jgi:DNA polymerase elongation subunit (family B)
VRTAGSSETRSSEFNTHLEGWIFDVYPSSDGMILWVIDDQGRPHRVQYAYAPTLYVAGSRNALEMARQALARLRVPVTLTSTARQELMSGTQIPVTAVTVPHPLAFPAAARLLARVPGLALYNCDILTTRLFFYETGLFPLARCAIDCASGVAREVALLSRSEDLEYDVPSLVVMRLRLESPTTRTGDSEDQPARNPSHGRPGQLEASVDGEAVVLDGDDSAETIRSLNRLLQRYDPDVLLTEWGDSVLLPQLQILAARTGIPLQLNRDPAHQVRTRRSRSYMTYGQVVYQAGARMLHGRWHIDLRNSFIFAESELAGLLEVARLARIPVQELARTSTGTAISSMQLLRAVRDGILIPWQKSEPEVFKTASQLIVTDKGGLTYQPLVGLYEQIGELDFSSMYPTIMAKFNVSPETIGCACCPDSHVPEINYTVCRRRRGLVPQTLDHLLERRIYYKQRKQTTTGSQRALYDQRQTALKWCLVTCLDAETVVPVKVNGQLRVAPIQQTIDELLPDGPGVVPVKGLNVFGYDEQLKPIENPVKSAIKVSAPPRLLRVRLQMGRELRMIPEHRCFVVQDNRLLVKRAADLREGDLIPVVSHFSLEGRRRRTINLVEELHGRLPDGELSSWRVFGEPIKQGIQKASPSILGAAKSAYTYRSIGLWRGQGYLPMQFLSNLQLTNDQLLCCSTGRGRREGGLIQQIPALLKADRDLGFLLGFFVGDGSGRRTFMRFAIHQNERDVADELGRILTEKFQLRAHLYKERKARMHVLQVNSVALSRIFEIVFGVGRNADSGKIAIPWLVWNAQDDVVWGFLSGLIASDGCVGKEQTFLRISSARKSFLDRLGILLISRGIPHRYYSHGPSMYAVEIVQDGVEALRKDGWLSKKHRGILAQRIRTVRSQRKISRHVPVYGPFACLKVRSIEEVPSSAPFVYCFEVEKPLRGFIVSGGIFTGNSFGYLGFRNARFGRIEAHEAVTAFAREMLLRSKEVAESRGFRMLHALVDSMWLQRPGATRTDYEGLAQAVTGATGLPIFVEGIYRWIGFLPSKTHRGVGVPNRYMGVFDNDTTKVRGIEVRRSDMPALVAQMQEQMLRRMFHYPTLADVRTALPEILGILENALVRLRAGDVEAAELVITNTLSQEVSEYRHNTVQAITARTLDRHGAQLHPGEAVQFILTDADAKVPEDRVRPFTLLGSDWHYDTQVYATLLLRAAASILELFGYPEERLQRDVWEPVAGQAGRPSVIPRQ